MKNILIYSMPGCAQCVQAADLMDRKGVPYKKVDIYEDNEAMNNMRECGLRSVPQIFLEYENTLVHMGDYKTLTKLTEAEWDVLKKS